MRRALKSLFLLGIGFLAGAAVDAYQTEKEMEGTLVVEVREISPEEFWQSAMGGLDS